MNKDELVKRLKALSFPNEEGRYDDEASHMKADSLLLEFIADLEVTETFNEIKKWYS